MKVYNIEYMFNLDKSNWKACILADDDKKALEFLSKVVNQPYGVTSIEFLGKVDGVSDEIIHRILSLHGVGREKKKEVPIKPVVDKPLILPDVNDTPKKRTRGKRIVKDKV